VACNFVCLIAAEGLIKVTGSQVKVVASRKRWKIKTLLLHTSNMKWYMTYRIAETPMTLSNLRGHAPNSGLFRWDISYSCTAVDKISSDIERRAVPLRQLSFLLRCSKSYRQRFTNLWKDTSLKQRQSVSHWRQPGTHSKHHASMHYGRGITAVQKATVRNPDVE